jgi:quercetin dioxygenase-like cupin family protein
LVDDRRHVRECTAAPGCRDAARRGSVAAEKSWRVNEIEAPGGRIDPAVLTTDDGARAIAIRLDPGQELRDHQVRERAWVVVVEGRATITSGDDAVEAEVGTLVTFEPGERHALATAEGARILLILAPWPGPGHYPEGGPSA